MRKLTSLAPALFLVLALCFTGCAPQGKMAEGYANRALDGAPSWVLMPEVSGMIVATGTSEQSPAGLSFQRTEAMADARDELARQLEVRVKNAFDKTIGKAGKGEDAAVDAYAENISRQCAKQVLVGSKQKDAWMAKDGTLHVLVVLDSEQAAAAAKKNVSSLMNQEALWQKFQHQKAQKEFQENFEKEFKSFEN
jgi:hypothetical protein